MRDCKDVGVGVGSEGTESVSVDVGSMGVSGGKGVVSEGVTIKIKQIIKRKIMLIYNQWLVLYWPKVRSRWKSLVVYSTH